MEKRSPEQKADQIITITQQSLEVIPNGTVLRVAEDCTLDQLGINEADKGFSFTEPIITDEHFNRGYLLQVVKVKDGRGAYRKALLSFETGNHVFKVVGPIQVQITKQEPRSLPPWIRADDFQMT